MRKWIKNKVIRNLCMSLLLVGSLWFSTKVNTFANTIWCDVSKEANSNVGTENYIECGETVWVNLGVDDGSYAIGNATLSVSDSREHVYVFQEEGYAYSEIAHPHVFDKPGSYNCIWRGKWANSSQEFEVGSTVKVYDKSPAITSSPSAKTVKSGNTATFSVSANGTNLEYQWYYATSNSGTGTAISGATSSSYSVTASSAVAGRYYYCVVSNSRGLVTSQRAKLTVTYTISYNANGGTGAPSSQTKYSGTTLTLSSTKPSRTGYTFLGWSTSSTATSATYSAGGSYTSNSGATLYAVWKQNTYTVSYNANGGTGAPSSQTKYYGITLILSSTKPSRTGYTFLGWSTSSTATSATYSAGGSYTSNSGATLYAVWKQNTYTVSYNANGGTGAPSSQTKYYGTTLTLSSTKPSRTGYTFLGWSTSSTATSATYLAGGSYTSNSGATLYAVWKQNTYTVSYNANGGTGAPSSQTKYYGTTLTLSSTKPSRTGYTFLGWSTSSTATSATYSAGGSYTSNSSATLYAVWKKESIPDPGTGGDNGSGSTPGNGGGSGSTPGNGGSGGSGTNPGTKPGTPTTPSAPKAQAITAASKTVAYKSKAFYLRAKASGGGRLTYASSNKKVATVSSTGKITVRNYGQTTITIKAAATKYYKAAVKRITIQVVPKKMVLSKAYSPKKKGLAATWRRDKTATGYQMYFSTRKDFKRDTYQRPFKNKTTKMSVVGLKRKKTYYVKIRAYKQVGKKKYWGTWSNVRKVRIK